MRRPGTHSGTLLARAIGSTKWSGWKRPDHMKDPEGPQQESAGGATLGSLALVGMMFCIVMDGMTIRKKQSTQLLAPILRHMAEMFFLNVGHVRFSDLREFADIHFSIYFPVFASLLAKASQAARVVCTHGVRRHSTCAVGWHLP